jgi:hypothetical protein
VEQGRAREIVIDGRTLDGGPRPSLPVALGTIELDRIFVTGIVVLIASIPALAAWRRAITGPSDFGNNGLRITRFALVLASRAQPNGGYAQAGTRKAASPQLAIDPQGSRGSHARKSPSAPSPHCSSSPTPAHRRQRLADFTTVARRTCAVVSGSWQFVSFKALCSYFRLSSGNERSHSSDKREGT